MRLRGLRRLLSPDDGFRAAARETKAVSDALSGDRIDARFRAEMEARKRDPAAVLLGTHADDPSIEVRLNFEQLIGQAMALVLGSTGSGKTRAVAAGISAMLERVSVDPDAPRPWVIDHKGDLAEFALAAAARIAMKLHGPARERFLDALVVVNPFSNEALVPLQVLARSQDAEVDEETQAYEVSTLFERLVGADLGVKQDALVFHLFLLGVVNGLTVLELPALLNDPAALSRAAASCSHQQVRSFFGPGFRLPGSSVSGLQARFTRLLRTPSMRLMLGAPSCLDFRALLRDKIVIANFGNPPLGAEDLARFFGGLFTAKTTRAIFDRPSEEASRKVLIVSDEWQEGLAGGREIADNYERVLAMSRSKGVAYVLVSQSLAGAAKMSSSLPRIVATNTSVQLLFRASIDDARSMTHLLPVTGRRLRRAALPWEGRREAPFLSRSDELSLLVEEVASLPDRTFYYWHRGQPFRAERVRTIDVETPVPSFLSDDVARRVRLGSATIPIRELEARRAGVPHERARDGQDGEPGERSEFQPFIAPPRRRPAR